MFRKLAVAALMCLLGFAQAGMSIEVVNRENATLNIHGRLQTFGFSDYVLDDFRDHLRVFLFVRQARLMFDGQVNGINYDMMLAFGGEELVRNTGGTVSNTSLGLLDFSADAPVFGSHWLKMGQFKVPYGLERLHDSGSLLFADRSIAELPFNLGRDVGFALHREDETSKLAYALAVMTGGGRDNPIRNLPLRLSSPMLVLRAGIRDGVADDLFAPKQVDPDEQKPGYQLMVNGMFIRDSRVGHSTVLQVKPVEKGLLTDANWNQYISQRDVTNNSNYMTGDLIQAGGDVMWRTLMGAGLFTAEAEANYGQYRNVVGFLEMTGARAQASWFRNKWGIGMRYAVVFADDKFTSSGGRKIFANREPMHEVTPSLTFFHRKNIKIVMDAPVLIDVPVAIENKIGYYVLTDQPDQTNVGTIIRQTVPSARMVIQFMF